MSCDQSSFDRETIPHSDTLYTFAFQMTGDEQEAADLVANVYVEAFRHFGHINGNRNTRSWMLARLQALIMDARQRKSPEPVNPQFPDGPEILLDSRCTTVALPEWNSEDAVRDGIRSMPEELRALIILRDIVDLPYEEIAGIFRFSVEELGARIHTARRWLLARLLTRSGTRIACSSISAVDDQ